MDEKEAKQKALAAGIEETHITPEILVAFGAEVHAPTEGGMYSIVVPQAVIDQDLTLLEQEMKNNSLPANIAKAVGNVLGILKMAGVGLCLAVMVLLAGCGSSEQARKAEEQQATLVKALNDQHLDFENRCINDFQAKEKVRIDGLLETAMKSATVKQADGTLVVPVDVANGLQKRRTDLLSELLSAVQLMRQQQATICGNYTAFLQYNNAMKNYLDQKAMDFAALSAALQQLKDTLTTLNTPAPPGK